MGIEVAFVILSDLHFGRDLFEAPETQNLAVWPVLAKVKADSAVQAYFEERCFGHSVPCVKKLPRYLQFLLNELQDQGYSRETFDLYILLGDQSTLASEQSYKFLREYLTSTVYSTSDGYITHSCRGLGITPEQLLAIPGNHDKLLRTDLGLYNREFTTRVGIDEEIRPQACVVIHRGFAGRSFLFILVDASVYASQELTLDPGCRTHLARGQITPRLRQDIYAQLEQYRRAGQHLNATAILMVHYAVDIKRFSGIGALGNWILPHECEGLDELVADLRRDFALAMVLHGHLHIPLLYNHAGAQVVSATTATQQGQRNGFFLVKILDSGEIRAEHHSWNGVAFTLDPQQSLSGPIGSSSRTLAA